MDSWRIKAKFNDKSDVAASKAKTIGAMAFKAPYGPNKFTYFAKGDTTSILNTFGYPSKKYPGIQDALDLIGKSGLWLARPYKQGKFGGVIVTPKGTVSFGTGVNTQEITKEQLAAWECTIPVKANGSLLVFEKDIPEGVDTVTCSDSNGTVEIVDGKAKVTFEEAPTEDFTLNYTVDLSDAFLIVYNHDQQADDLQIKVEKSTEVDDALKIRIQRFDDYTKAYKEVTNSPFTVSLSETGLDNNGTNIFIGKKFDPDMQTMVKTQVISEVIPADFVDDTKFVEFTGGDSGVECSDSDVAGLYSQLQDTTKFQLRYIADGTGSDACSGALEGLRNNYQKYTAIINCGPMVTIAEILADPKSAHHGITANRGVYTAVNNWGIHTDLYFGADFWCSNIGLVAGKYVDMFENGGGAPMWVDKGDGVGGQLGSSISKLYNEVITEEQLEALDELNLNCVINDKTYGILISSDKTRQVKPTVMSYISQSSTVDAIISRCINEVFPTKIGALLDGDLFTKTYNGCERIIREYNKFLEDHIVQCDYGNNTDDTRNNQTLIVDAGVIFKGFAEKILLNLSVGNIGTNVQELISK